MINYGKEQADAFDVFGSKNDISSILDHIEEQEKHYMELLEKYQPQIDFINSLLKEVRTEREQFMEEIVPEVRKKLREEDIDKEMAEEWISEFIDNTQKSFRMSESVIEHFVVKNVEEFDKEMRKAVNGGIFNG